MAAIVADHTQVALAALAALGAPKELTQLHRVPAQVSQSQSDQELIANLQRQIVSLQTAHAQERKELQAKEVLRQQEHKELLDELRAREAVREQEQQRVLDRLTAKEALREQEHEELLAKIQEQETLRAQEFSELKEHAYGNAMDRSSGMEHCLGGRPRI